MTLDPSVIALLCDPLDKGPLTYVPAENLLYNPRRRRAYPIVDDIVVLLDEEGRSVSEDEHQRLSRGEDGPSGDELEE